MYKKTVKTEIMDTQSLTPLFKRICIFYDFFSLFSSVQFETEQKFLKTLFFLVLE
jgi:hypothetical protein